MEVDNRALVFGAPLVLPQILGRTEFYRHQLRYTWFLHGHTVEDATGFHGFAVVGDYDELCLRAHVTDKSREAADVGFVEWCIDLVQDTEWARLITEDRD